MMTDPDKQEKVGPICELFTQEQEEQLVVLLSRLMAHGWGTLEIEVRNHQVKFFRVQESFPADM